MVQKYEQGLKAYASIQTRVPEDFLKFEEEFQER